MTEVVVIGGGQARLTAGYHLRRPGLDFVILDARRRLAARLGLAAPVLPAAHSSPPGRLMPPRTGETHPDGQHVVEYLADYRKRYEVHRVPSVSRRRSVSVV